MRRIASLDVRAGSIERSADPVLLNHKAQGSRGAGYIKVHVAGHRLALRPWSSVTEVKQRLRELLAVPAAWMRLFHASIELRNGQRLIDLVPSSKARTAHKGSSWRQLTLQLKAQNPRDFASECYLHPYGMTEGAPALPEAYTLLLRGVQQGLSMGLAPQLVWDGTGGTYVMRDTTRQPLAAFKPRDEEPFAPNNPRGLPGKMGQQGIHTHVCSGEAHIREVLAHRLDWGHFAAVPLTLQAEAMHPAFHVNSVRPLSKYGAKVGSLQEWVQHHDSCANRGASTFPVDEVHKIALLDMRLLNTDRNDSNILVRDHPDGSVTLIPIDHGGCLPAQPLVLWYHWCWLEWPQMREPASERLLQYVNSLDVAAEARLLADFGVDPAAIRGAVCATKLLQHGMACGLSLRDVAGMLCREDEEVPSELERLCSQAQRLVASTLKNPRLHGESAREEPRDDRGDERQLANGSATPSRPRDALGRLPLAGLSAVSPRRLQEEVARRNSEESGGSPCATPLANLKRVASDITIGTSGSVGASMPAAFDSAGHDYFDDYFSRLLGEAVKRHCRRKAAREAKRVGNGSGEPTHSEAEPAVAG